ncbi:MAG: SDR family NAD(P)-dependent oxidoreductase, partial [Pseudomonadales bacterium]|nr:SDR family NAD(P)-dependent oxidoreductase [Pseudomonadales bacterium]
MATVLITGTNRGIGLEFVKQYVERGDRVLATCRDPQAAGEVAELAAANDHLQLYSLDVNSESSMADFADAIKDEAIDVFINNAGVYGPRDASFG